MTRLLPDRRRDHARGSHAARQSRSMSACAGRDCPCVTAVAAIAPELNNSAGADRLTALMQQPTDISRAADRRSRPYTTRGDDASTLRVVDLRRSSAELTSAVEWGFIAFNEGNAVATGRQRLDPAAGNAVGGHAVRRSCCRAAIDCGSAAIDGDGRAAVMDLPLSVGLRAAGALQFSDVILGVGRRRWPPAGAIVVRARGVDVGSRSRSCPRIRRCSIARARCSRSPRPAPREPLKRFLMAARSGSVGEARSITRSRSSTAALPPGIYVASVIPHLDDQPVGRVSRRVRDHRKPKTLDLKTLRPQA